MTMVYHASAGDTYRVHGTSWMKYPMGGSAPY